VAAGATAASTLGPTLDRLFDEIALAVNGGLYFLGLIATLSIPDMCAGLESADGQTTGPKYIAWFDKWVAVKYGGRVTGQDCYGLRCSLLHQGRAQPHRGLYARAIFVEPGPIGVFHNFHVMLLTPLAIGRQALLGAVATLHLGSFNFAKWYYSSTVRVVPNSEHRSRQPLTSYPHTAHLRRF